jgi:glyoxylase-like metal-dependent hydrolase (beta-lactamase superfamily II)
MAIAWRVVNPHVTSNTYVCATSVPGECIVVDPGLGGEAVAREINARGLRPVGIFCTHGHFDHIGSASELHERHGAPIYMHGADRRVARSANFLLMACKIDRRIVVPTEVTEAHDGMRVQLGADTLTFHHTPGHTPGSCMIEFRGALFSGDTIYRDGVGLVDFPGEDRALLRKSIERRWHSLDEQLMLYPGHGGSARLGEVKRQNAALRGSIGLDGRELAA